MLNKTISPTNAYLEAKKNFEVADKNFDANPSKKTAKALSDARQTLAKTPRYSKEDQDRLDREHARQVRKLFMALVTERTI